MTQSKTETPIQAQIAKLELQRNATFKGIKDQLHVAGQSLRPGNIIRDALKDLVESNDLKKLALKAAGTVAVAFILKQILSKKEKEVQEDREQLGASDSFLDKTLASLMTFAGGFLAEQLKIFLQRQQAEPHEEEPNKDSDADATYT